jgi:hypothetical protein
VHERLLRILGGRTFGAAAAVGLAAGAALLLMTRAAIDHAPHYDELLHVLSARGLLELGTPSIADGLYTRAQLFTRAVAWSMRQFGDSLVSARLPALAAGVTLVALIGVWVTRTAGLAAGAAAAALLCVVPMTVNVAVFARFYTAHALVVAVMFIAVFEALEPTRRRAARAALLAGAIALLPLAWHFQEITVVAVGALVAAALAVTIMDRWSGIQPLVAAHPVATFAGVAAVAIGGVVLVSLSGLLEQLTQSSLWAAASGGDRFQYYLVGLRKELPLFWPLLPIAGVIALGDPSQRRLATFCLVATASALVVHSIAGQKAMRYVFYIVPWLCIVFGSAFASVVVRVPAAAQPTRKAFATLATVALLLLALVLSNEGTRALNLAAGRLGAIDALPFAEEPDWTSAVPTLRQHAHDADRFITSNSMKALYYFGKYDFELAATIVPETDTGAELGRDDRTGGRAIGSAESVAMLLGLPGTTLIVLEKAKIGLASGVVPDAFAVIQSRCAELSLPQNAAVRAWRCVSP